MGISIHPIICISDVNLAAEPTDLSREVINSQDWTPKCASYKPIMPGAMPKNLVDGLNKSYSYDVNVSRSAESSTEDLLIYQAMFANYNNAGVGSDDWQSHGIDMGTLDCLCDIGMYLSSNAYALHEKVLNFNIGYSTGNVWGINRQTFPINFYGVANDTRIDGITFDIHRRWYSSSSLDHSKIEGWDNMTSAVQAAVTADFNYLTDTVDSVEAKVKNLFGAKFASTVGISLPAIETTDTSVSSFGLTSQTACTHYTSTASDDYGAPTASEDSTINLDVDDGNFVFYINVLFPTRITTDVRRILYVNCIPLLIEDDQHILAEANHLNIAGAVTRVIPSIGYNQKWLYIPHYEWSYSTSGEKVNAQAALNTDTLPLYFALKCNAVSDQILITYDSSKITQESALSCAPTKITVDSPSGDTAVVFVIDKHESSVGKIKYSCTSPSGIISIPTNNTAGTYNNYIVASWRITFEMESEEHISSYIMNTVLASVGKYCEIILSSTESDVRSMYSAWVGSSRYTFYPNRENIFSSSNEWSISLTPNGQISHNEKPGKRDSAWSHNYIKPGKNGLYVDLTSNPYSSYFSTDSSVDPYCLHIGCNDFREDPAYSDMLTQLMTADNDHDAYSIFDSFIQGYGVTYTGNNKERYGEDSSITKVRIDAITKSSESVRLLKFGGPGRRNFGCIPGYCNESYHPLNWNIQYNASSNLKKLYYGYEFGFAQQYSDPSAERTSDTATWEMLDSVNNNIYLRLKLSDADAAALSSGEKTWDQLNVPSPVVFLRNKYTDEYNDVTLAFLRFGVITNSNYGESYTSLMDTAATTARTQRDPHSISDVQRYCMWKQESTLGVPFASGNYTMLWNNPDLMYSESILLKKPYVNGASYNFSGNNFNTVLGYNTVGKCNVKLFTSSEHMNPGAVNELNFAAQDLPTADLKMPNLKKDDYMMFTIPLPTLEDGNCITDINDTDELMGKTGYTEETDIVPYLTKLAKNSSYPTVYKYKLQLCPIGSEVTSAGPMLFVINDAGETFSPGRTANFVTSTDASKITYNIHLIYPGLRYERQDDINYDISKVTNLALYTHNWNNDLGADALVDREVASSKTALETANTKIELMYKYKYNEEQSFEDYTNGTWIDFDKLLFSDPTYNTTGLMTRNTLFGRIFAHICPSRGIHFFSFDSIKDEDGHLPEDYESQTFKYYLEQLTKIGNCAKEAIYSTTSRDDNITFMDNKIVDPSTAGRETFNCDNNNYYAYEMRKQIFPGKSISSLGAKEYFSGVPFTSSTDSEITVGVDTDTPMNVINNSWTTNCSAYLPNTVVIYNNRTDEIIAIVDDVYGIASDNPYTWIINLINIWSKLNPADKNKDILELIKYVCGEIINEKYNINIIHSTMPARGFNKSISIWPSQDLPILPRTNLNIISKANRTTLKPAAGTYTFKILGIDTSSKNFLTTNDFIKYGAEFETLNISITQP